MAGAAHWARGGVLKIYSGAQIKKKRNNCKATGSSVNTKKRKKQYELFRGNYALKMMSDRGYYGGNYYIWRELLLVVVGGK